MKSELEELLVHPKTKLMLDSFLASPAHALLITGGIGSGKRTIAMSVSAKLLDITPSALDSYPYFTHIQKGPGDREISVETVRELIKDLKLKTTGIGKIRRVVLIEDIHYMSAEGQNALLKSLEEPSLDTVFIATATSENSILSTIASRTQIVPIYSLSLTAVQQYYYPDKPGRDIEKAWQLSQGNVGLLAALLNDNEIHPLKDAIEMAKSLIQQKPYERLLSLDNLAKDKLQLSLVLDALNRVMTSLHHRAVRAGSAGQQKRLLDCRKLVGDVQADLAANSNPRLTVMHLAMNLSV